MRVQINEGYHAKGYMCPGMIAQLVALNNESVAPSFIQGTYVRTFVILDAIR